MRNYYKPGDWNAICDSCGFKFKASELKEDWRGLKVCSYDFETRHPQTLIRVPVDNPSVPWSRPGATDVFVGLDPISAEDTLFLSTETGVIITTET